MFVNRRDFLRIGGAAVSVSFLAPRLALPASSGDRILVILQLAGGNDAVNTFIPYTDAKYREYRPNLAIPDADILKVDSRLGFHPAMAKLVPLWEQRKFAFVNNVGFSTLDRSHFHCQDVWQTGSETLGHGAHSGTGWVGRFADLYLHDEATSLTSLAIGSRVPLGMVSHEVIPAAVAGEQAYDVLTDMRAPEDRPVYLETIRGLYGEGMSHGDLGTIHASGAEMFDSVDRMKTIPPPTLTAGYPESNLGRGFQLAAQVIDGGVGTRLVWVVSGGYDTHSGQAGTHAQLLLDVAESLAAFQTDLETRGLADRVVVMAWSEFGRRIEENGSAGTDHGKAGTVFLMGNGLNGGTFYGEVPRLADLDTGDLPTQIDFRSIYWTLISQWFGQDPEPVLMGHYEDLGFVAGETPGRRRSVRR